MDEKFDNINEKFDSIEETIKEIRNIVFDTNTNVIYILDELKSERVRFEGLEKRIKRIELLFIPITIVIMIIIYQLLDWLKG